MTRDICLEFHQSLKDGYRTKDKPTINTRNSKIVIICFFIGLSLLLRAKGTGGIPLRAEALRGKESK
jgi:hypothetical protein